MMNRHNPNERTSRSPKNLPVLAGEVCEVETGPQSYLELLLGEMAQEIKSRRASRRNLDFFELTFDA